MNTKQRLAKLEAATATAGNLLVVSLLHGESTERALELAGLMPADSDRVVFVTHYGDRIDRTPQFSAMAG
ncbi:MAG: hypothetical protein HQL37_07155 [Alphaproteobacteria bacterium]|nr:hypothetical protein [Alphaproteobacteria bacterium]